MNLPHKVDIDESNPMDSYGWIYTEESTSMYLLQLINIKESTPMNQYQ